MLPTRLFDLLDHQLTNYPQAVCLAEKQSNEWKTYSSQEVADSSRNLSCALLRMGVKPGDNIGMISYNCPAWIITDLAILQAGAVNVPMYPNATTEDYQYIINHAGIRYLFVGDEEIRRKLESVEGITLISFNRPEYQDLLVHSPQEMAALEEIRNKIETEDVASIIYTSGTTGTPKGVMLTHSNILSNVTSVSGLMHEAGGKEGDRILSFLPLSHIFERSGAYLDIYMGIGIYFAESMETIGDNIREVKPHILRCVPRLLEKIYERILGKGHALTGVKKKLFFWALSLVDKYSFSDRGSLLYRLQLSIADRLIFSKWREAFGGNIKLIISGAASLRPSLVTFFWSAGMPLLEGYGMTETSPVVTASRPSRDQVRPGCVGVPIDDVKIRIAEDGEILVKGPNVMKGYYRNEEATREVMEGGWLHTGDIGELVENRFLRITDRKKEMFKTSGGKYIAPQPMEIKLKESFYIEQAMVIGEYRKFPAAIITPEMEQLHSYIKRHGLSVEEPILEHKAIVELYQREVDLANRDFARYAQIKMFILVPDSWTVESGLVTPKLSLKRREILKRYHTRIEKLYGLDIENPA